MAYDARMYFFVKKTASGQTLQLLEAYRPKGSGSPRHRVVVSLGDMPVPEGWYKPLAGLLTRRLRGELGVADADLPPEALRLADGIILRIERRNREEPTALPVACQALPPPPVAAVPDTPELRCGSGRTIVPADALDGVLIDQVEHTHDTALGPLLCALHAWDLLGMPGLLQRLGFNDAQMQAAAALVASRLHEPMSENALVNWLPFSSLPDLLGAEVLRGGTDRYYRAGDKLFENAAAIEQHLRERIGRHFGLERTILLYDLTNFHFEGVCAGNPKARRGHNKQKRDDCPQVVLGLVFDEYGFALAHSIFSGNTSDAKSLPEMVKTMQKLCQSDDPLFAVKPTVIMDGGLATTANKKLLRAKEYHFLVNDKRSGRRAWAKEFAADGFQPIAGRKPGQEVLVRMIVRPKEGERLLLCKSAGRREKELAIRSGAEMRLRADLEKLDKRLRSGKLKDGSRAGQALGRLRERHSRVARYYDLRIETVDGRLALSWARSDERWHGGEEQAGDYILRTSRTDLSASQIWALYMTLSRAEDGFRLVKGELGLRPNHHQIEARVDAHTFTTILAYQFLRFILHTLEEKGDHRGWRILKRILLTHCYATVHLPTADGRVFRIRKPGLPEACQWDIYRALGIVSLAGLPVAKDVTGAADRRDFVVTKKLDH
jgi:transposase